MRMHGYARALIFVSSVLTAACSETPDVPPVAPPPEIGVVEVLQRDQPIHIDLIGQTQGSSHIPIRTRVEGVLLGMHFAEGLHVNEGDLLYTIDPIPYETKVTEALGYLAEARTMLAKAKADLERIEPLAEIGAASKADLDGATAQYNAALGSVQVANAKVKQARIQLGYTEISAPISGRIGITKADVGEFVGRDPNPVVLNFVSLIDPIRVRFAIDERNYLRLARQYRVMDKAERARRANKDSYDLILADGSVHPHRGRSVAYDAAIDPATGTFTLEADFPNPERLVLAGQFARVRAEIEEIKDALLIPERAISELQGIFQIYVIDEEGGVHLRAVERGAKIDRLRIIEKGLEAGDRVAVEVARLRPGMTIVPRLRSMNPDGSLVDQAPPVGDEPTAESEGG